MTIERASIRLWRDYAADWTDSNPVLAEGEPGFERDTGLLKIGDGVTAWNALDYINPPGGGGGGVVSSGSYSVGGIANVSTAFTGAFARVRAAATVTVPASVGDVLEVTSSFMLANQAITVYSDLAIVDGTGAIIRRRHATAAYGAGFAPDSVYHRVQLATQFVVASGDLVSGNVSVSPVARTDSSGNRTLLISDYGMSIDVVNIGQP